MQISILHLYITLFPNRTFIIVCYTVMAFALSLGTAVIFEASLVCRPFSHFWNPTVEGTCGNERVFAITIGVLHLVDNMIVLVVPLPMLWGLRMPIKTKVYLTFIFGFGSWYVLLIDSIGRQLNIFESLASVSLGQSV